jgi:hypothetical protein
MGRIYGVGCVALVELVQTSLTISFCDGVLTMRLGSPKGTLKCFILLFK